MRRGHSAVAAELTEYIFAGTLKKINEDAFASREENDKGGKVGSQHSASMSRQSSVSWSDWRASYSKSKSASYDSTDNNVPGLMLDSQVSPPLEDALH
jgi:hypothetical protein